MRPILKRNFLEVERNESNTKRVTQISNKSSRTLLRTLSYSSFTEKEEEAYKLLNSVIFDSEVVDYTTIIRTNFPEFENEEACRRDREKLRGENNVFHWPKSPFLLYILLHGIYAHASDGNECFSPA
ncbi:1221_t:CDS:2 [Funneliformis mosseae]|uniref:1221_t:CDS:1 n=1 Tax=Funneliformis mosseae TaxID=27381 RepID=A0A9N8VHA2_FUNMO|nr:1221_t:CDS:2 [Funneliformis mosseae]